MKITSWRVLVAAIAGLALVAAGTSTAQAAGGRGSSSKGYTQVIVAPEVFKLISDAGITPAAIKPATATPTRGTVAARFPISSVNLAKLRVKHKGGIKLSAGDARISLRNFTIELGKLRVSGAVSGSAVNADRAPLFMLESSDRPQFGPLKLVLTKTSASALNATFGVSAFTKGATFGYARTKPKA